MNAQLNYMVIQHRRAELRRAGERARTATKVPARRQRLRERNTITCPSLEPWQGSAALEAGRAIGSAR
jgi:hypothetical protein